MLIRVINMFLPGNARHFSHGIAYKNCDWIAGFKNKMANVKIERSTFFALLWGSGHWGVNSEP
jgi:hypothetical protein